MLRTTSASQRTSSSAQCLEQSFSWSCRFCRAVQPIVAQFHQFSDLCALSRFRGINLLTAIFKSQQGTEREKIRELLSKLSKLSTLVYGLKSRMEANVRRFIQLALMIAGILGASYFAVVLVMPLAE